MASHRTGSASTKALGWEKSRPVFLGRNADEDSGISTGAFQATNYVVWIALAVCTGLATALIVVIFTEFISAIDMICS